LSLAIDTIFIVQIRVINIDGTKAAMTPYKGFREYVKDRSTEIGLRGFVWRISRTNGKISAGGT
jgi:hypothetical protein